MIARTEKTVGRTSLRGQILFLLASAALFLLLFSGMRLMLLLYNLDQLAEVTIAQLGEAFFNGLRFDARFSAYALLPLLPTLLLPRFCRSRRLQRIWLTFAAGLGIFVGVAEPIFYREFHQRLNGLVFQYLGEDPGTVLSMLWHGFPVIQGLLLWLFLSWLIVRALKKLNHSTQAAEETTTASFFLRCGVFLVALVLIVSAARGTWRHGPPLRWGDAFTTTSVFANQLGLNGTLTLYRSLKNRLQSEADSLWKQPLSAEQRQDTIRSLLLGRHETSLAEEQAPVRRNAIPPAAGTLPIRNVVVILMESFAGRYVGALGDTHQITPSFDRLTDEGLLFTRFFANGTHTHQGLFATMTSFPNLPNYEYLMQMPEGGHVFSGLANLLKARAYNDLYVYNGDFAWDNQYGFFANQGMSRFVGRNDYQQPVVSDPTWGVSDQDMFERALQELADLPKDRPFFALLQTLSNHTPYALPEKLPIDPVTDSGVVNEHLTAMRYADWALGRFFDAVKTLPFYADTLFVLVGDHGFGNQERLTEMDLNRFHVPLLFIAPQIQNRFGQRCDTVGSQVDVVPTILSRFGEPYSHQCWGRDLLDLPADDPGFAVIKPSGSDQTMAFVEGENIYIRPQHRPEQWQQFNLNSRSEQPLSGNDALRKQMASKLQAYVETATDALEKNHTAAE